MKPDLGQLVAYWQQRLRLQDWRIAAKYVPDLQTQDGSPAYGICSPLVDNKTARIWIRDPGTPVPDGRDPNQAAREAVVHELVHLHFAAFGTRSPAEIAVEEQAVWALADALCAAQGTEHEEPIIRAMLANVRHRAQRTSAVTKAARRQCMHPTLLAALEAAAESNDMDMVKAILAKVKEAPGGGEPPMAQEGDPEKPPMAQEGDPEKPPMAARVAPPVAPFAPPAPRAARTAPSGLDGGNQAGMLAAVRSMLGEALGPVTKEIDAFKRDGLLRERGGALSEAQLKWARSQPYAVVKGFLDATPEPEPDKTTERAQRAARGTAPVRGAAPGASVDELMTRVDRAMRVTQENEPAVQIDPVTNRLMVSHVRPITVKVAGGERS